MEGQQRMRIVHVWKCGCGTRIRVIGEREPDAVPPEVSPAKCPTCKVVVLVDGKLSQLSVRENESWVVIEDNFGAAG
jgi:hypothetical protein